jgi:peptidase M50-like protein
VSGSPTDAAAVTAVTAPPTGEDDGGLLRLRPGVRRIDRPNGPLLVAPEGTSLRVGATVAAVVPLLGEGISFEGLAAHLRRRHPGAADLEPKLRILVDQLAAARLLEGGEDPKPAAKQPRGLRTLDVDPLARALARPLRWLLAAVPKPVALGLGGAVAAAAATGIVRLLTSPLRPQLTGVFHLSNLGGLALVLLVAMPLHELGHAVAARCLGVPVERLGIGIGFGIPRLMVETPAARFLSSATQRFWIPFAGPLTDFLVAGAAAWGMLLSQRAAPAVVVLFAFTLLSFGLNTSPLPQGDGSHMLEAILDDDWARQGALFGRRSRFSTSRGLGIYRGVAVVHSVLVLGALVGWWLR